MAVQTLPARLAATVVGQDRLKQAVAAAVITFLLASLIVGIELVSSTGALAYATRYREVFIVTVAVFLGSLAVGYMREGNPWPALIGGGVVTGLLLAVLILQAESPFFMSLVPFKAPIINWGS